MWEPIETPGEWLVFLQRKDIKGLPIMEARKKYMQEQLLFEAYENNLNTINTTTSAPASAAAGGGGQRKFKYAAQYQLVFRGKGVGNARGTYDRVAISDLKRYWYDNFFDSRGGGFIIPPPSIPSNIGSDFFFIKQSGDARDPGDIATVSLITWGTLGRGRQKGQWTYSEYKIKGGLVLQDCYSILDLYDKWNTFGFGSNNLSTPAGKWSITDVVLVGGKGGVCKILRNPYELTEFKPNTLPETIDFAREGGGSDNYNGNYSRNGVDENENPIWTKFEGRDIYNIYYSTTCGGWKVDGGEFRLNCNQRIKTNSTVADGPLGTYTTEDDTTRPPVNIIYTATVGSGPIEGPVRR